MGNKLTPEMKAKIDNMTQLERCRLWRFEPAGSVYFYGEVGDYFEEVLLKNGGFTAAISKQIGLEAERKSNDD